MGLYAEKIQTLIELLVSLHEINTELRRMATPAWYMIIFIK